MLKINSLLNFPNSELPTPNFCNIHLLSLKKALKISPHSFSRIPQSTFTL